MPKNQKLKNLLDGRNMKTILDDNAVGGIPLLFRIDMAGGATASITTTLAQQVTVVDVWVQNNAAGTTSDSLQLFADAAGTLAITDAIAITGADKTVASASTIDFITASTNFLTAKETDGGGNDSPACTVYVLAYRA